MTSYTYDTKLCLEVDR